MGNFRRSQNSAHPNKTNILMSAIIVILILIVTLQIWLMYGSLNNALNENNQFVWATFGGSLFLFVAALFLLKYLPDARTKETKDPNNKYE